jgi:hypothetical protein
VCGAIPVQNLEFEFAGHAVFGIGIRWYWDLKITDITRGPVARKD